MLKDSRERSAAAVRERIRSALTIVRDEPPDGHGLHRMRGDADRAVVNGSSDAAMIGVLWTTQEISRFGMDDEPSQGEIEVEFGGLASFYLRRREAWRKKSGSS
jgi:hypothetical protein